MQSDDQAHQPVAFLDGVGLTSGQVCVISARWGLDDDDERPTRILMYRDGGFERLDIPANIVSVCHVDSSEGMEVIALERAGRAFVIGASGVREEQVSRPGGGSLLRLHSIGATAYACGMNGQVYIRRDGVWEACDTGIFSQERSAASEQLRDIAGPSNSDLCAVGLFGRIALYDSRSWRLVESPTSCSLEQVVVDEQGEFWTCGDQGTVLHGKEDSWRVFKTSVDETFWGLAWFGGSLYLATLDGLWVFDKSSKDVLKVDTDLYPDLSTYRLDATETDLWSFGLYDIARFDGRSWERVIYPDNASFQAS